MLTLMCIIIHTQISTVNKWSLPMDLKEKEAREEMGVCSQRMQEIIDNAEAENRDLTNKEKKEFDDLNRKYNRYEKQLKNNGLNSNGTSNAKKILSSSGISANSKPGTWIDSEGRSLKVYGPEHRISDSEPEVSVGQMARAMLTGARNDAEKRALSEGTDSAGGFTVPSATLTNFFDKFRSKSRVQQAGARTIQLRTDETTIARVSGDPTIIWHEENASESDSNVTFEGVTFQPKTLMILVKASRELIADSVNSNALLESVFTGTVASGVDEGILFGSNSNGEMKGLTSYSLAEVDMGTNGAALTNYDPLVEAYRKMLDNNSVGPTAYLMAPREWETLATLKDNDLRYLDRPQALNEIPFYETTNIPVDESHGTANNASRIVTGNWSDLVIGLRQQMRIELLREKYADSYQFGFLVHMRVDAIPARDESFAQITGIIPSGT